LWIIFFLEKLFDFGFGIYLGFKDMEISAQNNKKYILGSIAGIAGLGSLWFYFSPYLMYQSFKQAADRGDTSAIAQNVDLPVFRESVKTAVKGRMDQEVNKQVANNNPLAALGAMFASSLGGVVVDPLVDRLVTPEGIATIMQGKAQISNNGNSGTSTDSTNPDVSMGYKSFNSFAVTMNSPTEGEMSLVFYRHGLSWKLSELILQSNSTSSN
jgi:hypothetical protein